jgi:transketolase
MSPRAATKSEISPEQSNIDDLCINTIRTLSIDAVQKANSGHPGTPMALAPLVYTLWQNFLRYDPENPGWPNRDRFILSNGHASMVQYSVLHLAGVRDGDVSKGRGKGLAVSLDDIKKFRQLDSKCPGHPEYGRTVGVEATTGPLGQGCGMSVGMALASKWLAKTFNKPGLTVFDYDVFTICGDGDMMEGISSEAASLAGHLMLGNLCWIYDNNRVTIEGHTDLAFSEDVGGRFKAYGWNVEHVGDVNDLERLGEAIEKFRKTSDVPTLIIVNSLIGYGAPHKQNTAAAHGEALGEEEVRLAKRSYGWPEDAQFLVPPGVEEHFREGIGKRGRDQHAAWAKLFNDYKTKFPELHAQADKLDKMELPKGWDKDLQTFPADEKGDATRSSGGKVINAIAKHHPLFLGGAADLAPSTKTNIEDGGDVEAEKTAGRNLHFGIREHAMGAVVNGLNLSGLRAFGATFLNFSDYMKPSIRFAALMEVPSIFVFTHDSIGLGEDGPTHQPIETLAGLRAIPGLVTLRPADANETVEAWRVAMQLEKRPACFILSRQKLPTFDRSKYAAASGVARGGYVMADAKSGAEPEIILISTGSEVSLCVEVFEKLKADGVAVRLVSLPSWELFEEQDEAYRNSVLPKSVKNRISVEAASVLGWDRYVGPDGLRIGMHTFGESAPAKDVYKKFGITADVILTAARRQLELNKGSAT